MYKKPFSRKSVSITRFVSFLLFGILTLVMYKFSKSCAPEYIYEITWLPRLVGTVFFYGTLIITTAAVLFMLTKEETLSLSGKIMYMVLFFSGGFSVLCFYYFLRVRVFGFRGFLAFNDQLSVIIIVQAVWNLTLLILSYIRRTRRVFIENSTFHDKYSDDIIRSCSRFGIIVSLIIIASTASIDAYNAHLYKGTGASNGYEYVDLGLDSGARWGTGNLLSSSADDLGSVYFWGEPFTEDSWINDNYYTSTDDYGDKIALLKHDAAKEGQGDGWSIPTDLLWQELAGCGYFTTYYKETLGITFVGPNKHRIFLPVDSETYYWSSSPAIIEPIEKDVDDDICPYCGRPFDHASENEDDPAYRVEAPAFLIMRFNDSSFNHQHSYKNVEDNLCYIRPVFFHE